MTAMTSSHTPPSPVIAQNLRARRNSLLLLLLLTLATLTGGLFWFAEQTRLFVPTLADRPLDAIVVLTGGTNRISTGFELLEQKQAGKLFISGVYRGVEVSELLKSWRASDQDLSCCITLGYEAANTRENAKEVASWISGSGIRSLYLVTSNYHMLRALSELHEIAPGVDIRPYPVSPAGADLDAWWRSQDTAELIVREYVKYLAATLRHLFLLPDSF